MGYSPFVKNRPIFDTCEITLNRHKQSRKQSQIILERFWRRSRKFRTISRSSKNRPCSKPWARAQGFCSKSANFRHLRNHPKSTQTVAEAVTNYFRTVLEAFQRVSNDFQEFKKSAMFKTMGYSSGLLLKMANFRPVRIPPKSTQTVAEAVTNHFRTVLKAFQRVWSYFQDFTKSAIFKAMGYSPFVKNRPIFNTCEFTLTRHKQSRKHSQIILERFWRRFREFRTISRSSKNRPCSKPWVIAQGFCSKSANFRPVRIPPKSTQTVAEAVTNHFRTVLEAFQRVWDDFQDLPKSAMFKAMGYSPGPLLKIGQFSIFANSP